MVFYVTMATFWMTLLMNKWTNIVMDDEWVHPSAEPYVIVSKVYKEQCWINISIGDNYTTIYN